MKHVGEPDRGNGRDGKRERREKIDLMELGAKAGEPAPSAIETIPIGVEQDEARKPRRRGAVEQHASADARFEMLGGKVVAVESDEPLCRAAPGEAVRQAVNEHIVNRERERRVQRMRFRDGVLVKHSLTPSRGSRLGLQ